jgi:quinol monooxygenase YgiN
MIYLITRVTLVQGKRAEYIKEFKNIIDYVLKQKGCIEYDIYVDSTDQRFDNPRREDMVVLSEKWVSIEDLQEHSRSAVMNEFRGRIKGMRASSTYELLLNG